MISKLLWKTKQAEIKSKSNDTEPKNDLQDEEVLENLNNYIHHEIKNNLTNYNVTPFHHSQLNINSCISKIHTCIWKAIIYVY